MIKVIDNFFDDVIADRIYKSLVHKSHAWYLPSTVYEDDYYGSNYKDNYEKEKYNTQVKDYVQFFHEYVNDGKLKNDYNSKLVEVFLEKLNLNINQLIRLKVNLKTKTGEDYRNKYSPPHTDQPEDHIVVLYYVNDSDGPTYFFNDDRNIFKQVEPKKNRCVIFDGKIMHASGHCIDHDCRLVINVNVKKEM